MYNVMKFQAPFERVKNYNLPEVSLYKSIITQAIIDCTNISDDNSLKLIEKEAKEWIFGNSRDFKEICYKAEIEPHFIIKLAKKAITIKKNKINKNK